MTTAKSVYEKMENRRRVHSFDFGENIAALVPRGRLLIVWGNTRRIGVAYKNIAIKRGFPFVTRSKPRQRIVPLA